MRLHTNILTEADVRNALDRAKARGNVDKRVHFLLLEEKGSRKRDHAFEVRLEWFGIKEKGDGRRWSNSGSYGADSYENGEGTYAAFRDEWGWFIAEVYDKDEHAIFGFYEGMDDFNRQTRNAYEIENSLAV